MTVPARLLSVRLQGFKSFATRTVVEFGPGICAVVGPNGAGKSNLADALRWALGEQGRALRTRRSEDIIFAGSEARPALGMTEVTVVLENADGLLPVDYSVVELGRRLFRSGENEYLLNGTRVRLRDLQELLDAARLADNAFLFIGQGMVDQALALRPEERRPLFEEVAGVRRHDRRKRAAQEQLTAAEVNLARVRDILAELRPQARRLAAQAEQQAARDVAGAALADAVVAAGRERWSEAATGLGEADIARQAAQGEMDAAIAALRAADDEAFTLTEGLDRQLAGARAGRAALDDARGALQSALVANARLLSDREALSRERSRVENEAAALAERVATARRQLAAPLPSAPPGGDEAETLGGGAEAAPRPHSPDQTDEDVRDRLAARQRALRDEETALERGASAEREAQEAKAGAIARREAALHAAAGSAEAARDRREAVAALEGRRRAAEERIRAARAEAGRLGERLAVLEERLGDAKGLPLPAGAEAIAPGLHVETRLRGAVEAALGAAARGAAIDTRELTEAMRFDGDAPAMALALRDRHGPAVAPGEGMGIVAAAVDAGGGRLADAVAADPSGVVRRVLGRSVWVPDLTAALALVAFLAPGWIVATVNGEAIDASGVLLPAPRTSLLASLEERSRMASEEELARRALITAEEALKEIEASVREGLMVAETAARTMAERQAERDAALEAETAAARRLELSAREVAWSTAQVERLRAEIARMEAASVPAAAARAAPSAAEPAAHAPQAAQDVAGRAARAAEWNAYRAAIDERRRLEGSVSAAQERGIAIAAELERLAAAQAVSEAKAAGHAATVAELESRVSEAVEALAALDVDEGSTRDRLRAAEVAGRAAREQLRVAENRARAAEVSQLEARMALDGVREQLLVELAGLGAAGWRALGVGGRAPTVSAPIVVGPSVDDDDATAALEAALDALTERWASSRPSGQRPAMGRIAALRRRYHELGAANPYAAEEHAEVRRRLADLESQRDDLERAISATRRLITDLERLIAEQFETTFRALESAFDRRFSQLFGGGHARLALTTAEDPAASGVEIVARPPGKKAQALAMLSGGERALTAVALLFAMLEVRPVPFCVLDEVDAALDESNIGRFAEALRELAEEIQFVVITHNRGTIEQADALYGITIGEDAISRVVSLRLEGRRAPVGSAAVRVAS